MGVSPCPLSTGASWDRDIVLVCVVLTQVLVDPLGGLETIEGPGGGHHVPESDIRRRFSRSIRNFWEEYRHLADSWHLFYNGGAQFHEVALGEGDSLEVRDEGLFDLFLGAAEGETP